jgi:hypothetical protein
MLGRACNVLEMIGVVVLEFQRALAVLNAFEGIENLGFRTL